MSWPGDAALAVSITIDVDGTYGLPDGGAGWEARLSSRAERNYGIRRGLPRILAVLDHAGARATFYVPGAVASEHPATFEELARSGHEIAHHGHRHLRPDRISASEQRHELESGLEAITSVLGAPPTGYRAPEWELAPETLGALAELGFTHDSSLLGDDDRPYRLDSGTGTVLELPVHWTLDDAPHFAAFGGTEGLVAIWRAELAAAAEEGRHVTFTMHPEIIGRPHRVHVLEQLVEAAQAARAWVAPHRDVVSHLTP
jgi:peptidoglycan-N-acetylglucosamine deacetylase